MTIETTVAKEVVQAMQDRADAIQGDRDWGETGTRIVATLRGGQAWPSGTRQVTARVAPGHYGHVAGESLDHASARCDLPLGEIVQLAAGTALLTWPAS